jgi:photosystem II stability/assembly factor-like uncharacterized protein
MSPFYIKSNRLVLLLLLVFSLNTALAFTQNSVKGKKIAAPSPPDSLFNGLKWRNIGPFRGGRSLAVAGHADQPLTYYFGATGGGVWKTENGGYDWYPISDSTFKSSSVGAITVAPSDKNVVYVGMGEADMRSDISFGDGMYKSVNGGKNWTKIGLEKADAIGNIEVHPANADIVFVAALGNPFHPNPERGIYRSTDGGKTWKLVLSKDSKTGGMCVRIDPNNPRVVYATLWEAYRNGHSMSSGGKGSGLYKSIDGGDTWLCLNEKPGMPVGILGKIGLAVSPVNSNRLYSLIENDKGGLYISNDAGDHWELINEDKNLWQRPWYYMNMQADPKNENGLIVLNVNAWKSIDGGKTFKIIPVGHGDTHDVWINPKNPDNFIIGDDGGAEVTFNGGENFSDMDIPTCQFYHVSLDNDFPYNIYGAQQDNSSIRIASRTYDYSIGRESWFPVAGGEAGYIQPDPTNSDITYGGEYDGSLSKYNSKTKQFQAISPYPEANIGAPANAKKFRFQWTFPILFSPHNPKRMYVTSQYVLVTEDGGYTFEIISPDLTRNDPKTTGETGGPITKDQTGAEVYATIFTITESPVEQGVLWTGSDDGLVHISKNNGITWENVSPPTSLLPEFSLISIIHSSDHTKGKAYLAANKYMYGDRTPYLFKTSDYGKTWTKITAGIPSDEYCRVVREDPNKPGLLYAGTERGIYVSFSDGDYWQKLNLNLPITPVRDLQIQKREKDLVIATHGLAFWILDDITPLYEIMDKAIKGDKHLFKPRHAYRMQGGQSDSKNTGTNAPNGVLVRYYLKNKSAKELQLQFLNDKNDTIITYSSLKTTKGELMKAAKEFHQDTTIEKTGFITNKAGMNSFTWNMRYPDVTKVAGTNIMWAGTGEGVKVYPGNYKVRLIEDKAIIAEQTFEVKKDPGSNASDADLKEQFDLHRKINKKVDEAHIAINQIRTVRKQISGYIESAKDTVMANKLKKMAEPITTSLDKIEATLMQPKAKAPQDVLAFPIQLNDKMAGLGSLISSGETKPTKASYEVYEDLANKIETAIAALKEILDVKVAGFNSFIKDQQIPAIIIGEAKK